MSTQLAVEQALPEPQHHRQHKRYPTNWPGLCTAPGVGTWTVTIVDASEGGFGLSSDLPLPVGAEFTIAIDQVGEFACAIAWKGDGRCGLRLLPGAGTISDKDSEGLAFGLEMIAPANANR